MSTNEKEYDKLYRVDNLGIKNTITGWSLVLPISAPSVLEMERDEDSNGVVDKLFSFEKTKVDFKKYRKYHCEMFEDATIMNLIRFYAVITEVVDFLIAYWYEKHDTLQIVRGHETEVEGCVRLPQKWFSRKEVRSLAIIGAISNATTNSSNKYYKCFSDFYWTCYERW